MNYLTLASNVRQHFGIYTTYLKLHEEKIFILLQHINETSVIFVCPKTTITKDVKSKITFNSVFGNIELNVKVDSIFNGQYMFSIEGTITGINKEDFLIALNNFLLDAIKKQKRREERILCTKENLRRLRLLNTFTLPFKKKFYNCMIKDISSSSLKCITSIDLLQHVNERFSIVIKFYEPEEVFVFNNCFIVRKNEIVINDIPFAELVICLRHFDNNFKYRIECFFNRKSEKLISKR